MLVYHYYPATYEYIATTEARIDPIASSRTGELVYLCPAYATFIVPPEPLDDNIRIFNETTEEWSYQLVPAPEPELPVIEETQEEEINIPPM